MKRYIAIVGGGPKGLYGLERVVAYLSKDTTSHPIEIHFLNQTSNFGSGDIYNPSQPDYLWINYAIGNINMWIDETPSTIVPNPLPLVDWLQQQGIPANETDFISRGQVGRYLQAGLKQIIKHLPTHISCKCMVGRVVDIWEVEGGYKLKVIRNKEYPLISLPVYHHILLATGHPRNWPDPYYEKFSRAYKANYTSFVYPVEPRLTMGKPSERVIIKGMGLTFIDAVLALTEGRGGRFSQKGDKMVYHPSGKEPDVIYPFSRSGLPMIPRAPQVGSSTTKLRFFTHEDVQNLKNQHGKLDIVSHLWPLLSQDFTLVYYEALFKKYGYSVRLGEISTFQEMEETIKQFHDSYPHLTHFSLDKLLNPLPNDRLRTLYEYHNFIINYLRSQTDEAADVDSPLTAVTAVWRTALPVFRRAFAFGGLTPASQRIFHAQFASPLNRISFGPPIPNMEKIIALAKADFIRFDFSRAPQIDVDKENGGWRLLHAEGTLLADTFIDARIPSTSYHCNNAPLYANLLRRGLARPFVNRDKTDTYEPGCLDISSDGFLIGANGRSTHIALTGTPTEGIVYDNDSLSRHCNNFVSGWAKHVQQVEHRKKE